jgi:hypothetical protein
MGDIDDSLLIHHESASVRLNWKRAEEPPLGREPLDSLIAELGGVDLVVLANRNADTGIKLPLFLATAPPLQQKPWRIRGLNLRRASS